jgi:DNA-binding NtrC family response regulator
VFLVPEIAVLHVGKDSTLLSTRSEVLRRAGFYVVPTASTVQAMKLFLAGDFDLVIICHSVPADERRSLANLVHSHSSSIPVVLITVSYENDLTVDATVQNDPRTLLINLPEILRERSRARGRDERLCG